MTGSSEEVHSITTKNLF